jgi:hypothetical protein
MGDGGTIVSSSIVSAVDANTGEPLDPGSFGVYPGTPGYTDPAQTSASSPGLFTSPNAYTSGTGLGPLNLPSPLSTSLASTIAQYASEILIGAVILAGIYLYSMRER